MVKNDRVEWLDTGRGIGIILVVLGHCFTTIIRDDSSVAMLMYEVIFFVHMPFWFYLSGYGYKITEARNKKVGPFFVKKVKTLLTPYISYSALIFIVFYCCTLIPFTASLMSSVGFDNVTFSKWIKGLIVGDNLFSLHLWYIYVLFFFQILTYLLRKVSHNKYLLLVVGLVFLIVLYTYGTGPLIAGIPNFLYFYIWYVFAIIFPFHRISFKLSIVSLLISGLFFTINYKYSLDFLSISYIKVIILMLMKSLAVMGILGLTKAISLRSSKILKYLGRNSFSIYLLHQPLIGSILGNLLYVYFRIPMIIVIITTFTLGIIIPLLFTKLLKRTRGLKYVFGISN